MIKYNLKYNMFAEFIASLAGMLTIIAYIPQAYKIYLTNKTNDLDINTFILLFIIKLLWIIWGFTISSVSVIVFGAIQMIIISYMLLKINKNSKGHEIYYHKHYNDNYMRINNKY